MSAPSRSRHPAVRRAAGYAAAARTAVALAAGLRPARAETPRPPVPSRCDRIAANLVTTCGFEGGTDPTGTVPNGYTSAAASGSGGSGVTDAPFPSGQRGFLSQDNPPAASTLSQTLATTAGQAYTIRFWATNVIGSGSLSLRFGGASVFDAPIAFSVSDPYTYQRFTAAGVATGALASPRQPRPPAGRPIADVRYRCAGGAAVRARYYADRVRVTLPGGEVTLPQAPAASGIRYANDTLVFWSKGADAFVTRRDRTLYADCHDVAAR